MPTLSPRILYVDEDFLVADKPAGLRSIPAGGEGRKDCLAARVRQLYPDALIVHRLDQATSGIVLFARGATMLARMNHAFRQRLIGKHYVAVVSGHVLRDEGEIDLPLAADPARNPYQRVDPVAGLPALTRFRVLARLEAGGMAHTRLLLKPVTGRTHQLRVHLLSLGHPIIGDPLYAPASQARGFARMHLHAARIALFHPRRAIPLSFESPLPF